MGSGSEYHPILLFHFYILWKVVWTCIEYWDYDIINYVPSLSTFIQIELPIQNGVEIKKTVATG